MSNVNLKRFDVGIHAHLKVELMEKEKQISQSIKECLVEKHQRTLIPREERVKYILGRGWTEYYRDSQVKGKEDDNSGYFFTSKENSGIGLGLDTAYELAYQKELEAKTKIDKSEGNLVIHCNKCGADCHKKLTDKSGEEYSDVYQGLINAECSGGYFSEHLSDGIRYTFSLCEKCLTEMFETFKKYPELYIYM